MANTGLHGKQVSEGDTRIAYCTKCAQWVKALECDRICIDGLWFNECQKHDKSKWQRGKDLLEGKDDGY